MGNFHESKIGVSDEATAVVRRRTEEVQGKGRFEVFEELRYTTATITLLSKRPWQDLRFVVPGIRWGARLEDLQLLAS